jgi:hypothetical protein
MSHRITTEERERMREFASTPKYKRTPGILEPAEDDAEE